MKGKDDTVENSMVPEKDGAEKVLLKVTATGTTESFVRLDRIVLIFYLIEILIF